MSISITLTFATAAAAAKALMLLDPVAQGVSQLPVIQHEDRPDTGAVVPPPPPAAAPAPQDKSIDNWAAQSPEPDPRVVFGVAAPVQAAVASIAAAITPPVPPAPPAPAAASVPAPLPVTAPPVAPPAPSSPTATVAAAGAHETDADGLPWDSRIHAGGRAKNADGRWRQKRGLNDPALKKRVEDELRQAMAAGGARVVLAPPAELPPLAATPSPPVPAPPAAPAAPPAPPVPPAPAAPQPAFPAFISRLTPMLVQKKVSQEALDAALQSVGLSAIAQLVVRDDLVAAVEAKLAPLMA